MEILFIVTIICYLTSTINYIAYLIIQKDRIYKTGYYLLIAGFLSHTAEICYEFITFGHLPVNNLHQVLSVAVWAIAGAFLIIQYKYQLKILGVYAAPLITLILLVSSQMPRDPGQVKTIFKSIWLIGHVIIIFIGEASFALACGIGVLYLLQEHAIKTKNRGFIFKRLPSLELLDTTGYACIVVGFTLLTVGLITGFLYARLVWGRFWSWDPKEVWSGITWLFYAALLHERLTVGWRGRKAAIMSIIGFAVVLFTFFGVNFILKGHHGEFTRW